MDQKILKRYFDNTCTPSEAEQVVAWFKTAEGRVYLKKKLEEDLRRVQDERIQPLISNLPSEDMWNVIEAKIKPERSPEYRPRRKTIAYWQTAAAILLLLTASVFYLQSRFSPGEAMETARQIHYTTEPDQQKTLTLRDGTTIRLNSNAQLWISETYGEPVREVALQGEAHFEVIHDEEKPFVIHTAGASIKDLGTAFNVRALPDEDNVQVTVTEGKVSIWAEQQSESEATELIPGQFGYLDLSAGTITVDDFEVHNYLSWMNGRFKFYQAPLEQISRQLHHLYGVSFVYAADSLKTRALTTDFQRASLDNALEVIALTLDISYRIEGEEVVWLAGE